MELDESFRFVRSSSVRMLMPSIDVSRTRCVVFCFSLTPSVAPIVAVNVDSMVATIIV